MFGIRAFYKHTLILNNLSCQCDCMKDFRVISFYSFLRLSRFYFSETKRDLLNSEEDRISTKEHVTKILKIAIIGTPNVGKSTFINQVVGRRVCAVSDKVHTTRIRARAAVNINDTQVVFLDTPGLVSLTETNKHNLEQEFLRDGEMAMAEANVIGVIHDVSNHYTRGRLDPKVLRLLHLYPRKHSVLILNKVDTVKKKRYLLELSDRLSCKTLVDPKKNRSKNVKKMSEEEIMKEIKSQSGWPHFSQVFMVSALEDVGVGEVMEYIMQFAQTGPWMFSGSNFTDQKPEKIILDSVKAKLLDCLPKEIPYNIRVQMELYNEMRDGTISTVVLITCPHQRYEKLIIKKIRWIAENVETDLRSAFFTQVLVRLAVQTDDK